MASRSLPVVQRKEGQLGWKAWKGGNGATTPDDSLTNLQWLQEFSFLPADPEAPSSSSSSDQLEASRVLQCSYGPASPPAGDTAAKGMPPRMGKPTSSSTSFGQAPAPASETVDYKTEARVKPPYSYATLICMAMRASREAKVTLSAIYAWIMENFCYYRHAEPSWQNSIRHNLSLNKCFQKVPRGKDEPGKGGFWQINPQYADTLINGVFPRKRMPALPFPATSTRHGSYQRESGNSLPSVKRKPPPPLLHPSQAAGRAPSSPVAEISRETAILPGNLSWASGLEGTFAAASEDLELTAALGALAPAEDLASLSHQLPLSALSKQGLSRPATPSAEDDLVLRSEPLTEPWEEAGGEPVLGGSWGLEEDPCFAESFLVGMQPWEV